jgi:hypothetical protein
MGALKRSTREPLHVVNRMTIMMMLLLVTSMMREGGEEEGEVGDGAEAARIHIPKTTHNAKTP